MFSQYDDSNKVEVFDVLACSVFDIINIVNKKVTSSNKGFDPTKICCLANYSSNKTMQVHHFSN